MSAAAAWRISSSLDRLASAVVDRRRSTAWRADRDARPTTRTRPRRARRPGRARCAGRSRCRRGAPQRPAAGLALHRARLFGQPFGLAPRGLGSLHRRLGGLVGELAGAGQLARRLCDRLLGAVVDLLRPALRLRRRSTRPRRSPRRSCLPPPRRPSGAARPPRRPPSPWPPRSVSCARSKAARVVCSASVGGLPRLLGQAHGLLLGRGGPRLPPCGRPGAGPRPWRRGRRRTGRRRRRSVRRSGRPRPTVLAGVAHRIADLGRRPLGLAGEPGRVLGHVGQPTDRVCLEPGKRVTGHAGPPEVEPHVSFPTGGPANEDLTRSGRPPVERRRCGGAPPSRRRCG